MKIFFSQYRIYTPRRTNVNGGSGSEFDELNMETLVVMQ